MEEVSSRPTAARKVGPSAAAKGWAASSSLSRRSAASRGWVGLLRETSGRPLNSSTADSASTRSLVDTTTAHRSPSSNGDLNNLQHWIQEDNNHVEQVRTQVTQRPPPSILFFCL
ncbi:hypothetical protein SEVIR_9G362050v4 [Setaria viridis]